MCSAYLLGLRLSPGLNVRRGSVRRLRCKVSLPLARRPSVASKSSEEEEGGALRVPELLAVKASSL